MIPTTIRERAKRNGINIGWNTDFSTPLLIKRELRIVL